MVTVVTRENFQAEVLESDKPVLVDFWAEWCGPCRMISPVVSLISEENDDFKVCKIDVDAEPMLAQQFGIMSIPTLLVFKNGELADRSVGLQSKYEIESMVKKHV